MKWLTGSDGMIWCISASYSYVNPLGFKKHVLFCVELPGAVYRYMKLRAKGY